MLMRIDLGLLCNMHWLANTSATSLVPMPIANALTFNCRAITLFIALMLGMPWLYWAAELTIFNALCIYMVCRHEAMCRKALLRLN